MTFEQSKLGYRPIPLDNRKTRGAKRPGTEPGMEMPLLRTGDNYQTVDTPREPRLREPMLDLLSDPSQLDFITVMRHLGQSNFRSSVLNENIGEVVKEVACIRAMISCFRDPGGDAIYYQMLETYKEDYFAQRYSVQEKLAFIYQSCVELADDFAQELIDSVETKEQLVERLIELSEEALDFQKEGDFIVNLGVGELLTPDEVRETMLIDARRVARRQLLYLPSRIVKFLQPELCGDLPGRDAKVWGKTLSKVILDHDRLAPRWDDPDIWDRIMIFDNDLPLVLYLNFEEDYLGQAASDVEQKVGKYRLIGYSW